MFVPHIAGHFFRHRRGWCCHALEGRGGLRCCFPDWSGVLCFLPWVEVLYSVTLRWCPARILGLLVVVYHPRCFLTCLDLSCSLLFSAALVMSPCLGEVLQSACRSHRFLCHALLFFFLAAWHPVMSCTSSTLVLQLAALLLGHNPSLELYRAALEKRSENRARHLTTARLQLAGTSLSRLLVEAFIAKNYCSLLILRQCIRLKGFPTLGGRPFVWEVGPLWDMTDELCK